jgi:probable rRNA maturation factor
VNGLTIDLELQIASNTKTLPHPAQFREWVGMALCDYVDSGEVLIRLVDEPESQALNKQYRNKDKPTNVLSFPYADDYPTGDLHLLGDIIICAPIIETEATLLHKPLLAHWAHVVVHGLLHLIGFDHEQAQDAVQMESLETEIIVSLGFPPPYGDNVLS